MSERRPRDTADVQEQADGALTQQLCEARGVMDGEEVELAIRVESALEDQGVEMRVKPERISNGPIGENYSAGDAIAGCRVAELRDQRVVQPGDEAEEPLVVTEEYPKSFGDCEDKLSVGKGEQQLLVEVLGEEKGPLLAAGRA